MELHDVALPGDPKGERAHGHAAGDAHAGLALVLSIVCFLVQHLPLGGEFVFRPHLLQMDQAALARAIQPMLESGKRQELVFGEHAWGGSEISNYCSPSSSRRMLSISVGENSRLPILNLIFVMDSVPFFETR